MDGSETYSHMYNLRSSKAWLHNSLKGSARAYTLPSNVFSAEVPLGNLVMTPLAPAGLVAAFHHHNVGLVVSPLFYTENTIVIKLHATGTRLGEIIVITFQELVRALGEVVRIQARQLIIAVCMINEEVVERHVVVVEDNGELLEGVNAAELVINRHPFRDSSQQDLNTRPKLFTSNAMHKPSLLVSC